MRYSFDDAFAILSRTPDLIANLLSDLDDSWTRANYGPDTWSPFDIVGHLIWGDLTDWVPRATHILQFGDTKPFEPFDRNAQLTRNRDKTMSDLLAEFRQMRVRALADLHNLHLSPADLARKGLHPALGPVNMEQLLSTWVVHDLHHIAQICKAMAFQYRENVGAWKEYLGILPR